MSTNPVRDLHDAVARNRDPVIASTRPATTTAVEMARMVEDVIAKLRPDGSSVVELGCGIGVLAEPIARRASRYVGVDMAQEALNVLKERIPKAVVRCADVTTDDISDLGTFDRVLVYTTLHLVASEADGERFVQSALGLLAPGGLALFGNLPLPSEDLPHSRVQRTAGLAWSVRRRLGHRPIRTPTAPLPAGYALPLTRPLIEGWLAASPGVQWDWLVPRIGVPMHRTRADLVVKRGVIAGTA